MRAVTFIAICSFHFWASALPTVQAAVETASVTEKSKGCAKPPRSSRVVNVRDKGAVGDGRTNDTAAIQAAIDAVAGTGGTVLVPNGRYLVDATGKLALKVKSDMTLKLAPGATLKVIPNKAVSYSVLHLSGVSNVTIEGGTLVGDRNEHRGALGEWGMGIRIDKGSSNITVSSIKVKKMWGDAFYVSGAKNVTFCAVNAEYNRRQGLSVIAVDGMLVTNSIFKDTRGTRPSAGIDLEPNNAKDTIRNVRIENSKFIGNAGPGILVAGKKGDISKLEITNNLFEARQPIVIENAPHVSDSRICRNRQITGPGLQAPGGFEVKSEGIPVVIVQDTCGDRRIVIRRGKGK